MSTRTKRMIFVNLPVKDLAKTKAFWPGLGFEFNAKFTDEKAACMILEPDAAYVMLLSEPFFQGFMKNGICDTRTHTETLLAFSCESPAAVRALVERAFALGATPAMDPQDHGFMFGWSFRDPDGHHWEPHWMDPAAAVQG